MRTTRRHAWTCLAALVVLLWAGEADAGVRHKETGFQLDLPHGFRLLSPEDVAVCPGHGMDLVSRVAPAAAMTKRVFLAGPLLEPEALLVVARIEVDPGSFGSARRRQRYMLDRLHLDHGHFEALVAEDEVTLNSVEISDHDALEMIHAGVEGPLGLMEPAAAAVLVDAGSHILVVALLVRDTTVYPVDGTWAPLRGSLKVHSHSAFAQSALLYGGVGMLALLVLVLLTRWFSSRRRARGPAMPGAGRVSMTTEGWGHARSAAPPDAGEPAALPPEAPEEAPAARTAPPRAEPTPLRAMDSTPAPTTPAPTPPASASPAYAGPERRVLPRSAPSSETPGAASSPATPAYTGPERRVLPRSAPATPAPESSPATPAYSGPERRVLPRSAPSSATPAATPSSSTPAYSGPERRVLPRSQPGGPAAREPRATEPPPRPAPEATPPPLPGATPGRKQTMPSRGPVAS